ncbi:MAG: hypothetical protein V3T44_05800, partial [bacterium]
MSSHAEVSRLHVLAPLELLRRTRKHDRSLAQDVGVVGYLQGQGKVLFYQEDGLLLLLQAKDGFRHLLDQK